MEKNTPGYLDSLENTGFLPTQGRLFAAFSLPVGQVRFVLMGEGPYPREASASGYCFMDGAVQELWSADGLSKPVNRAVSLRNFIKMLLVDRLLLGNTAVTMSVAATVCCTIVFVVMFAKVVGSLLPMIAEKIGVDPAVMASPLISTITDAVSLLIYFSIAKMFLHF